MSETLFVYFFYAFFYGQGQARKTEGKKMKTLGYYNGRFGELDEMTVPMNDRVSWFGDGVYDAGPSRNYKIFALDEHIDRFFNSAGLLKIQMPVTKKELKELLQEMVDKMEIGRAHV